MRNEPFEVRKIAGNIGAEIHGIDISQDLSDETVAALRKAWLENLVLFFREQDLPPARFLAFAKRFGETQEYPFVKGLPDYPEVITIAKLEHEKVNFGGVWHSDTTYLERPPMASMLVAREVPPRGGDTMFANGYLAYETLSDGLKKVLDGLVGVSSSAKADVSKTREDRIQTHGTDSGKAKETLIAKHPAVRTHPETGRKALFVNTAHTTHFDGWTVQESKPLLDFIHEHQIRPEFTCRFRWREGSVAMWDNRCALHYPLNDYHGFKRVMHRITLAGDVPH
jgi:taurine dioxygenase